MKHFSVFSSGLRDSDLENVIYSYPQRQGAQQREQRSYPSWQPTYSARFKHMSDHCPTIGNVTLNTEWHTPQCIQDTTKAYYHGNMLTTSMSHFLFTTCPSPANLHCPKKQWPMIAPKVTAFACVVQRSQSNLKPPWAALK